jgi:hypothetical protein
MLDYEPNGSQQRYGGHMNGNQQCRPRRRPQAVIAMKVFASCPKAFIDHQHRDKARGPANVEGPTNVEGHLSKAPRRQTRVAT